MAAFWIGIEQPDGTIVYDKVWQHMDSLLEARRLLNDLKDQQPRAKRVIIVENAETVSALLSWWRGLPEKEREMLGLPVR